MAPRFIDVEFSDGTRAIFDLLWLKKQDRYLFMPQLMLLFHKPGIEIDGPTRRTVGEWFGKDAAKLLP